MSLEITIDGVIGNGPNEISAQMVKAQLPTTGEPITVKIHSEGGSVFEGFAIYDALAAYKGQKTAIIESSAFSIASFIPMACDQIEITPNGYMMLHNPYVGVEGDDEELAKQSQLLGQLKTNMVNAYVQRTGKPEEEIRAILKQETYLNANDAVAMGFCNRITEKPITGRVFARLDNVPHGVVSALFGAGSDGNHDSLPKEKPMSDSTPVAATIDEIEAAFPKMKPSTVLACLKAKKPLASVAQAAVEEMMAENQEMAARCKAMEEELAKYKSMEPKEDEPAEAMEDEEEVVESKVTARGGVKPIAKAKSVTGVSARARWNEAVKACLPQAKNDRTRASQLANRQNPGLREAMLAEVNAR
jgi:ATP-dependent protease ClpP protease subunit